MEIELWELKNIIKAAAEEAVKRYAVRMNPTGDEITERQAFREFGEGWVKHQLATGLLERPKRKGTAKNSPKVYSRMRLAELKDGANPLLASVTIS